MDSFSFTILGAVLGGWLSAVSGMVAMWFLMMRELRRRG